MPLSSQVPAYILAQRQAGAPTLAEQSVQGMGSALPPHISIQGNSFTLIDVTGATLPVGPMMDCIIVDVSNHMCKRYYESDWGPNSDSPPDCWSANGIGPSRESVKPQAQRCDQCQWNVRGSDTSKLSGKAIKACRDEKWMAIVPSNKIDMAFRLVLPPGSFKNWASFVEKFKNTQLDIVDVVVRITFQPQANGVMQFEIIDYIPEKFVALRNQMKAEKGDLLVGRIDVPVQTLLPTAGGDLRPGAPAQPMQHSAASALSPPAFGQPQGAPDSAPTVHGSQNPAESGPAVTSPAGGAERAPRRRRQAAEPAPVQAPFPTASPSGFTAAVTPAAAPSQSGFGVASSGQVGASSASMPAGNGTAPSFGMSQGATPDPALAEMLKGLRPQT